MKRFFFTASLCTGVSILPGIVASNAFAQSQTEQARSRQGNVIEEVVILETLFADTADISPSFLIDEKTLEAINFTTIEDALAYAPNLVVRRRFIGDPNGVVGIRGSNMFQGTRTSVYVDGMPIHYHLQTRFSGSPRWSLVSPGETERVEVLYGPFSAEYSGNAMGGVVNVQTRTPEERKVRIEGTLFSQEYDQLATDERFNGGNLFVSYEDRFDDLTVFASYNRLDNSSQPQTQFRTTDLEAFDRDAISGETLSVDERNRPALYYGDSGPEQATTDLFKVKLGYALGEFDLRANIAYEQRERDQSDTNNFLTDADGQPFWFGGSNFQSRNQERDSLLVGLGLSGPLAGDWVFDAHYSRFEILKDEEVRTARSPDDPDFEAQNAAFRGRFTEFDDTGWEILNFKAGTESLFGNPDMRLSVGAHYDNYRLEISAFNFNAITGETGSSRGISGGETNTLAAFAQYGYRISPRWDLALGLRYETWEADETFSGTRPPSESRDEQGFSPKFSIAYFPTDDITIRYSAARALRFAIVEELFRNEGAIGNLAGSQFVGDPTLKPEDGIHQNLSIEKILSNGSVSLNLFYDVVDDTIFNSSTTVVAPDNSQASLTTALPVSEVTTQGAEFVLQQFGLLGTQLDVQFNVSYTDATISENVFDPSITDNQFPRIPEWRSNLLLSHPIGQEMTISGGLRYASNSFGRLDNADTGSEIFGAQDEFLFINSKLSWQPSDSMRFGVGIDNILDEQAFVFHPWPGRTAYLESKFEF
ncbi:MAG: TonB-dependent receptor [Pseudomonadota bacterium]